MKLSRVICIMLAILMTASCGGRAKAPPKVREVAAAPVVRGTIERRVMFTGNIVAQDAFDIYPRAAGKISKKLLKEGDPVKRNQPILLVERDEVGYSFKQMPIVSLVDGLVGTISVDVGSAVDQTRPVATVVRPGNMRVKLDVPERYLGVILPGTQVKMEVDSLGGDGYSGTIVTSSPVVSEKTRTANVEVDVPNVDGGLRHGMFGRLNLVVERREGALMVPGGAISWEGDKQFVYRIKDGKLERTQVKPGLRNDEHVEILEGLSEGLQVVVGNLIDLKDGEMVNVKARETNAPSPL
ncbi:MAG: efflux RND transporter periplasmic adaptor subunit [bacterium]